LLFLSISSFHAYFVYIFVFIISLELLLILCSLTGEMNSPLSSPIFIRNENISAMNSPVRSSPPPPHTHLQKIRKIKQNRCENEDRR
jgi:hypothetical protein